MAQLHKYSNFNITFNNYTSAYEGLRNATPNHAKIRRGMVSLWIDGRLMFSIWRQNQDVKNQWEFNGQMKETQLVIQLILADWEFKYLSETEQLWLQKQTYWLNSNSAVNFSVFKIELKSTVYMRCTSGLHFRPSSFFT